MKEICHARPGGRHFSPLMPGDRYLYLRSRNHLRAGISENFVRYETLPPRPEVVRSFYSLYENKVIWVLFDYEYVSSLELNYLTPSETLKMIIFPSFQNCPHSNFPWRSQIDAKLKRRSTMFERVDTNLLCPAFGQFISHIAIINRYVAAKIVLDNSK